MPTQTSVRHLASAVLCCFSASPVWAQISMVKGAPFEATRTVVVNQPGEQYTTSCMVARSSNGSTYQEVPDNKTGAPTLIIISDVPGRRTIVLNVKQQSYTWGELSPSTVSDAPSPEQVQKSIDYSKTLTPTHTSQDGVDITITPLGLRTQDGFVENRRTACHGQPASFKQTQRKDLGNLVVAGVGHPGGNHRLRHRQQASSDHETYQHSIDRA